MSGRLPDKEALARAFARGRVDTFRRVLSPEKGFAERFKPRVDRRLVRNADDPEDGYETRTEATFAAIRYRDACRALIGEGE